MDALQYQSPSEAAQAGAEWIKNSTAEDKLCFLKGCSSCTSLDTILLSEMIEFIGQDGFNKFFCYLQRKWDIKTPQEFDFMLDFKL
jgi:hypothetical protein